MQKRILSLVLALSLCISLFVAPARAADIGNISLDVLKDIAEWLEGVDDTSPYVNNATYARQHYTEYSYQTLEQAVFNWNAEARNFTFSDPRFLLPSYSRSVYFDLQPLAGTNFYAIRCYSHIVVSSNDGLSTPDLYNQVNALGYWTDSMGNVAVCSAPTSEEEASTSVQAIPRSQAAAVGAYRMLSYEDLYNLAYDYNAQHNYNLALNTDGVYWAVSSRGEYVLANESGLPYGAAGPSSVTSGGSSRPDEMTNDDHIINWLDQSVGSNDGVIGFDSVIYDSNNKTYYVDNSVAIQNSFNQTYYYNWSYTYNIDYTNITYIGSSAEYTETYECYYTLPDGRSSADLTKEDLEQLNLSMDVVPYQRSADDTRLRSLYHFDGNTEDASYWNYATSFDWTSGASLTYLESNAFNGCLYLDELAHDFTITLPSSLGSGDFTVDFRYYQSSTISPQNDSYISIGGQEVLRLDGSHFIFNGTNYSVPVGSWNHLAFVRKDGTLKFYLNGVQQGSRSFSSVLSFSVRFSFGTSQQTYKYFDELRVTNFAVWTQNFTPPAVPYDTNLSLVLPTDTVPVADEYWDIHCDNNLISSQSVFYNGSFPALPFGSTSEISAEQYNYCYVDNVLAYSPSRPYTVNGNNVTLGSLYSSPYVSPSSLSTSSFSSSGDYGGFSFVACRYALSNTTIIPRIIPNGLFIPVYATYLNSDGSINHSYDAKLTSSSITLSMVSSSGEVGSYSFSYPSTFSYPQFGSSSYTSSFFSSYSSSNVFNGYIFSLFFSYYKPRTNPGGALCFLSIIPTSDAGEFVYLALEDGTESTVTAEFVSGVAGIPADDLNTPTLAVRSDIPMPISSGTFGGGRDPEYSTVGFNNLKSFQIGGVRPSFAERGFVYAMVESGYITSLQQYTGYSWQAVDGRIWTGSRWIPYSSYNVITLSDMYDIVDASGQEGYEYIYSEPGFWSWWQKQWLEFKQWYTGSSIGGGGDTVVQGDTINNNYDVDIDFGESRNNSVGLLEFVQKVLGDVASGFTNFTLLYLSPDNSLDVLFPSEQSG